MKRGEVTETVHERALEGRLLCHVCCAFWSPSGNNSSFLKMALTPFNRNQFDAVFAHRVASPICGSHFDDYPHNEKGTFRMSKSKGETRHHQHPNAECKGSADANKPGGSGHMNEFHVGRNTLSKTNNTMPSVTAEVVMIPSTNKSTTNTTEKHLSNKWGTN